VLAAVLAVYPLLSAGRLASLLSLLAVTGFASVLAAPHIRGPLTGVALFTLAAGYVLAEATGRVPALSVVGYAAGLILMAELLMWAAQLPRTARADAAVALRQALALAVAAFAAAALALVTLAAGGLRLPGPWTGALLGTAAAAALLALPWLLLRRTAGPGPDR
jgi:hypothetical protein